MRGEIVLNELDDRFSSVENPLTARDYLIKVNKIRELVPEAELGPDVLKAINQHLISFVLQGNDRCVKNRRKRIFPHDL